MENNKKEEKHIINQYIDFALEHWFLKNIKNKSYSTYWEKVWNWDFSISFWYTRGHTYIETKWYHFHELLFNGDFIEAIAIWVNKISTIRNIDFDLWYTYYYSWFWISFNDIKEELMEKITNKQGNALRKWKIEEFIKEVLWIEEMKDDYQDVRRSNLRDSQESKKLKMIIKKKQNKNNSYNKNNCINV